MLNFVAKAFRGWMNILLWLMLIGSAIGGFVGFGNIFATRVQKNWYSDAIVFNVGYAFLGLLICGVVGLITVIIFGGLIANFLSMVDDIQAIRNYLSYRGNSSGGNSSGANLSNVQPVGTSVVNSGETWVCKKCNTSNNITASFCKDCGEAK
jgi:hypothetical protein